MSDFNFGQDVTENEERIGEWSADESGIQKFAITQAYLIKSARGASALTFKTQDKDENQRNHTIYFTNAKGETFYKDKNKGNQVMLPGYQLLNNLCRFTVGKSFQEVLTGSAKKKVISVYDYESRADIDKEVVVLPTLYNKLVVAGVIKVRKNKFKNKKKTSEEVFGNEIKIIFHPTTGASIKEVTNKVAEADLKDKAKWVKSWTDRVQDDYEEVEGSDDDDDDSDTGSDAFSVDPFNKPAAVKTEGQTSEGTDDNEDALFTNLGDNE